ncbi:MAG: arginine-tRNA-protein transferase [Chloracidobacterium sp.]|nr:arginine-tRNA-protein transferase [Chloracidobacterium sp.]
MDQAYSDINFINEYFEIDTAIEPAEFDMLLADGWRHFGTYFSRYSLGVYGDEVRQVLPLRVRLSDFEPSKSQRRILKRNQDIKVDVAPPSLSPEVFDIFERHKLRFEHHRPDSLFTFISRKAGIPTDLLQLTARCEDRIVAVSFFDAGVTSVSAIYACFEPEKSERSLGIFTMLKVIEWGISRGMSYYYPGYAYVGPSFYDYKKRFSALECFDWEGNWTPAIF